MKSWVVKEWNFLNGDNYNRFDPMNQIVGLNKYFTFECNIWTCVHLML